LSLQDATADRNFHYPCAIGAVLVQKDDGAVLSLLLFGDTFQSCDLACVKLDLEASSWGK